MTQMLVATLDLYASFYAEDKHVGQTITAVLRLVVPTLLAWLAGTLPLAERLPAKNVATGKDVSCVITMLWLDTESVVRYPQIPLLCLKIT